MIKKRDVEKRFTRNKENDSSIAACYIRLRKKTNLQAVPETDSEEEREWVSERVGE